MNYDGENDGRCGVASDGKLERRREKKRRRTETSEDSDTKSNKE